MIRVDCRQRGVGILVMVEICQSPRWIWNASQLRYSIVMPIFKGKGDIWNCSCYGALMFLEHGMKVVEWVLERRLHRIVFVDEMQFGFMPERGAIDAVFILRRMHEEFHAKGKKLYMCFVEERDTTDFG